MQLQQLLHSLGFSKKEVQVYLLLIELGTQPAATLAKKLEQPKSTVLFVCEGLVKRGFLRKSRKGRTQFFHANPQDLRIAQEKEMAEKQQALDAVVPLLEEIKSPFSSEPKVTFYEGADGCRRAYQQLLESTTEIVEFGIHEDLTNKLGEKFMEDFISERVKRGVFLRAIANDNDIDRALQKLDKQHCREQRFFSADEGRTYSSIAIFENKVLLLNLHRDAFGIMIENKEMNETLRTLFELLWNRL